MEIYEIVCGAIVLLVCILIVILCMMQDQKQDQNMTSALGGGSNDSFYKNNESNTRDVALQKLTRNLGIIAVLILIAMNIVVPLIMNMSK
ncbi:MAG: preprotein translocase subunit SecG [Oscillospiraceae bacterium]|nr:preprotein translocase subunit SecG [Oscillospiraceae bacterium]MDE7121801.1 preprotein translocase subunit SecG [Oscillospiraceae bacterium]